MWIRKTLLKHVGNDYILLRKRVCFKEKEKNYCWHLDHKRKMIIYLSYNIFRSSISNHVWSRAGEGEVAVAGWGGKYSGEKYSEVRNILRWEIFSVEKYSEVRNILGWEISRCEKLSWLDRFMGGKYLEVELKTLTGGKYSEVGNIQSGKYSWSGKIQAWK